MLKDVFQKPKLSDVEQKIIEEFSSKLIQKNNDQRNMIYDVMRKIINTDVTTISTEYGYIYDGSRRIKIEIYCYES